MWLRITSHNLKAGFAIASVRQVAGDLDNFPPGQFDISDTTNFKDELGAVVLGGGLEVAAFGSWSVKAEYLHFFFESKVTIDPQSHRYKNEFGLDTFKLGLVRRF